jgi:RimJ/RimL family protein N-acetyltransferase
MPWVHDEPTPLEEKVELLRSFRERFEQGEDYVYGILTPDGSEAVGGTGLHRRVGEGAFEIGYWISAPRDGTGYATEVTAALTRVAFELCGVDRMEIHVDPDNERSCAIPLKLGYREEARLRRRLPAQPGGEPRDVVYYTLFADAYPGTPSASARLEAYDATGARVL